MMNDEELRPEKHSIPNTDLVSSGLPLPKSPVESILIGLLALFMLIVPAMSSLSRIAIKFLEPGHSAFIMKIGQALQWVLPKDLYWASMYTQHATLWIGFLGAVVATSLGKHLGLATSHFMRPGKLRSVLEAYCNTVFVGIALVLCHASLVFVRAERVADVGDGTTEVLIETLPGGIPRWWSLVIIPLCFGLMAVRMSFRMTAPSPKTSTTQTSLLSSMVRWSVRIFVMVLTIAIFYFGLQKQEASWITSLVTKLTLSRKTVEFAGLAIVGIAFLLGTPIFVAIAGITMMLLFGADTPIAAVPEEMFQLVTNPQLPAIPLLTIAGYILASGKSAQRLVRAYKSIFGFIPGGVALMALVVCAVFTTFTGASGVTILALGGLMFPALLKEKYPQGFSLGLVTAAGSLGMLFPPSLPVILYSMRASAPGSPISVGLEELFIGGLLPGLLMILLVGMYAVYHGIRCKAPRQFFHFREMVSALWAAKWDLLLPFVVIVPFATGLASIVESSALGAAYALVVGLAIHRDLRPFQDFPFVMVQAATLIGAIIALLGVSMGLTNYLVQVELPALLVEWVQAHIHSQWAFLLVLNVVLLVLGSILEVYSAILILVPLIAPLADVYHIDPVHLGVVFLANLELGFLLPPVGLNLLLSSNRFRKPLPQLYKHALPFLIIMTIGVLIVTYFEGATTWLVHLLKK